MKAMKLMFALSFGLTTATIAAPAHAAVLTYIGAGTNWFSASNWDLGYVPGPSDDVIINAGHIVVISPASGPSTVAFRDITITNGALLETLAGIQLTTRNETLTNGGQLIHRATRALDVTGGGTLTVLPPGLTGGTGPSSPLLNPTPKTKRDILLKSSVTFGLGGTLAASNTSTTAFGAGHYATITTDNATLEGSLDLALFYGFVPSLGQTFQIITVGSTRVGTFTGLGEGAFVRRLGNVGMYISYVGGDGNDVVLTTGPLPRRTENNATKGLQWARWDAPATGTGIDLPDSKGRAPVEATFMTFVVREDRLVCGA